MKLDELGHETGRHGASALDIWQGNRFQTPQNDYLDLRLQFDKVFHRPCGKSANTITMTFSAQYNIQIKRRLHHALWEMHPFISINVI